MEFGPVPVTEAEGAILAHSVVLPSGRLRKGIVLGAGDVALLHAAGHRDVTVARLGPDDVSENDAAAAVAAVLAGVGLRASAAKTGRVNIYAEKAGLLMVNARAVLALNRIDPMITLATLPHRARLAEGTLLATVKIISYGVDSTALSRACLTAVGALKLRPVKYRTAGLVQSVLAGGDDGEKGRRAVATRLERLGVDLISHEVVEHRMGSLTAGLCRAEGAVLFILTGSATSDLHDVAPEAVRLAGGKIHHFGMPVDPGNLLFLGELEGRPVIGLPGCARSPALNGADWVMERILCGLTVSPGDIAAMGVGGLLKEMPSRPHPREG
ncbi:MAG TPA: molybdopterin biosynthesis protein [Aliiroseovarius sp.]|nr:molybdopterin biosynthesis protein [Aliiroseovarius sp.]